MSIIGLDIGSSSVKSVAYSENFTELVREKCQTQSIHTSEGIWEQNPQAVWECTKKVLSKIMQSDHMKKDPPTAISISVSGRENFPADAAGRPLGNIIMTADTRGEEYEITPTGVTIPEQWELDCGHLRERMDPANRLLWWKAHFPEIMEKARYFPDWHGYLSLQLCGRNVSDVSLASRWACFDLKTEQWNEERLQKNGISHHLLPEVMEGGTPIDTISNQVADEIGLPHGVLLVTGGFDINCAGLGTGVTTEGTICLSSGSYETMIIPTVQLPSSEMLLSGLSVMAYPSKTKRCILAASPTGTALLNWAEETVNLSYEQVEHAVRKCENPSPVMTIPFVSGAFLYWKNRRSLRAAVLGATLATKPSDIVQAFMESIAYDHVNTLSILQKAGITVERIRNTGGGSNSDWWVQLKSDIIGLPIEVTQADEPGTFGAALLAGKAIGLYRDIDEASRNLCRVKKVFYPNSKRAANHLKRMELYNATIPVLNEHVFAQFS